MPIQDITPDTIRKDVEFRNFCLQLQRLKNEKINIKTVYITNYSVILDIDSKKLNFSVNFGENKNIEHNIELIKNELQKNAQGAHVTIEIFFAPITNYVVPTKQYPSSTITPTELSTTKSFWFKIIEVVKTFEVDQQIKRFINLFALKALHKKLNVQATLKFSEDENDVLNFLHESVHKKLLSRSKLNPKNTEKKFQYDSGDEHYVPTEIIDASLRDQIISDFRSYILPRSPNQKLSVNAYFLINEKSLYQHLSTNLPNELKNLLNDYIINDHDSVYAVNASGDTALVL